jgi:hypothetical protein
MRRAATSVLLARETGGLMIARGISDSAEYAWWLVLEDIFCDR